VASNFSQPIKAIAARYEELSDHQIILIFGSTGKHYAQIINGAPFELFFAADTHRPHLLEQQGLAISGSRFTYARGRLVLWSSRKDFVDPGGQVLASNEYKRLAIANPKLAPYGKAAREVLERMGLWQTIKQRLVQGESIGQTYQFVKTGNAELGFIANSQIMQHANRNIGSYWLIPQALYEPIEQQVVLLKENTVARDFLSYIQRQEVKIMISQYGYDI
jgi:molybdate transport system substrate-binding protein